jgi:hypothetical protein
VSDASDLRALFRVILDEVQSNPNFAARIRSVLRPADSSPISRRPHRRAPAALDPFALYSEGDSQLQAKLRELNVEQLKDIVAEYGMDSSQLSRKWKSGDRLVDLIVRIVEARAHKGDAFRK